VVILFKALYMMAALLIAVYGIQAGLLSLLYLWHRRDIPVPPRVTRWPTVTIQLPVYNEFCVIERLLRSVTRIEYPRDLLQIQVLDDSTDETTELVKREIALYRQAGIPIDLTHREHRTGYKAGALQ